MRVNIYMSPPSKPQVVPCWSPHETRSSTKQRSIAFAGKYYWIKKGGKGVGKAFMHEYDAGLQTRLVQSYCACLMYMRGFYIYSTVLASHITPFKAKPISDFGIPAVGS